jgi:hypothetical protein
MIQNPVPDRNIQTFEKQGKKRKKTQKKYKKYKRQEENDPQL